MPQKNLTFRNPLSRLSCEIISSNIFDADQFDPGRRGVAVTFLISVLYLQCKLKIRVLRFQSSPQCLMAGPLRPYPPPLPPPCLMAGGIFLLPVLLLMAGPFRGQGGLEVRTVGENNFLWNLFFSNVPTAIKLELEGGGGGEALMARPLREEPFFVWLP